MTEKIRAPWTSEQVDALNRFQRTGGIHPFTCGGDHAPGSPLLVAYADGWRCPQPYGEACDYTQDWAHAFMADPSAWPQFPFGERHGPTPEEMKTAFPGHGPGNTGDLLAARFCPVAAAAGVAVCAWLAFVQQWLAFGLVLWLVPLLLVVGGLAHRAHNRPKGESR